VHACLGVRRRVRLVGLIEGVWCVVLVDRLEAKFVQGWIIPTTYLPYLTPMPITET